jgi:hypothetical protein
VNKTQKTVSVVIDDQGMITAAVGRESSNRSLLRKVPLFQTVPRFPKKFEKIFAPGFGQVLPIDHKFHDGRERV